MQRQAVYELMQSGDANAVSAAAMGESSSSASKGDSSLLEKLQGQDADLRIQAAQLSTQFGPSYPKVQQLNTQLKEVSAQIHLQTKKILDGVHDEYMAALQREKMLSAALDKQKQQANALNKSRLNTICLVAMWNQTVLCMKAFCRNSRKRELRPDCVPLISGK